MINHRSNNYFKKSVHSFFKPRRLISFLFLVLSIFLMFPGLNQASEKKADFLFKIPKSYIGLKTGIFFPDANSGVFDMTTRELTLDDSDFRSWIFGADLGFKIYDQMELVFSLDHSDKSETSEFRNYVDLDGYPINQTTDFIQTPLTIGVKYLFIPRGRAIGEYSWIPSPIVPQVSAGAGYLWYEFTQKGDFVDSDTLEIFPAYLESSGSVPTVYFGCGIDFNIYKATFVTFDLKYSWAEDDMDQDFVGFDPIDLSGIRLTAGIQWHF